MKGLLIFVFTLLGLGTPYWRKPMAKLTQYFATEVADFQSKGGMISLGKLNRELHSRKK